MKRDLQDMLDVFFAYPNLFTYKELNQNLQDAGMPAILKIVPKLIDVMPYSKAIYDQRGFGDPVIFDISAAIGGHYEGLTAILDNFYPETSSMNECEVSDFVVSNFEFLGGAAGALVEGYEWRRSKDKPIQKEWKRLKECGYWWGYYNSNNQEQTKKHQ